MEPSDCKAVSNSLPHTASEPDSLFERWAWFYSLCREYLFRDHTEEIAHSLFPADGPLPSTQVLELGCGPGFYACKLAQQYPQIATTGIDLSEQLIARARSRASARSLGNCTFRHGDAQALPELPGPIDAVIVSRLFLIVPNKEAVLAEILRVLRPGGRCFIAEPTSGFRTRLPLSCMWLLARLTTSPAGKYREPQQAEVMSRFDFASLIHSQPWGSVELEYDGWYQYAVCTKAEEVAHPRLAEAPAPQWSVA